MSEELKRALALVVSRRRTALIVKRQAGDPRNPFRAKYGEEQTFAYASQEAATLLYILKVLETQAARECARRAWPYIDRALDILVAFGLIALGILGVAAVCIVAGAPDPVTRATACIACRAEM